MNVNVNKVDKMFTKKISEWEKIEGKFTVYKILYLEWKLTKQE